MKKTITTILMLCMLITALPSVTLASNESDGDTLRITVSIDTWVGQSGDETGNNNTGDSANNLRYQITSRYFRQPWLYFDLSAIQIPAGKQIASAKFGFYLSSYYNKNTNQGGTNAGTKASTPMNLYFVDEEIDAETFNTLTWEQAGSPTNVVAGNIIGSVALCPNDEFDEGPYEIDITDYIKDRGVTGSQIFALSPEYASISGNVYSMEVESGAKAAYIEVTFGDKTQDVLSASDFMNISDPNNSEWGDTDTADTPYYTIHKSNQETFIRTNYSNGNYKRAAYIKFPLDNISVPAGKVITSAKLRLYVTAYSGDSQALRTYELNDDSWTEQTITWNNAPEKDAVFTGRSEENAVLDCVSIIAKDEWYEMDVTKFVSSEFCKANADGNVSFALYPDFAKNVNIAGRDSENQPELVITYGDAADVNYEKAYFTQTAVSADTLGTTGDKTRQIWVTVPVTGASSSAADAKLYIAEYASDTKTLLNVHIRDISVYSANGTVSYGFVSEKPSYDTMVSAFIWNGALKPLQLPSSLTLTAPVAE